ncbi:16396_t:CDS:2 [Gigaspora margarita]|uniref:16396_t:CDS:1 n=1 Tax=Gigaspora margarita TaxID=4874 RepID=A0ABN7UEP4_GIGMA|nr:16396_t:CDS:2 [Gigaspora margarita]
MEKAGNAIPQSTYYSLKISNEHYNFDENFEESKINKYSFWKLELDSWILTKSIGRERFMIDQRAHSYEARPWLHLICAFAILTVN